MFQTTQKAELQLIELLLLSEETLYDKKVFGQALRVSYSRHTLPLTCIFKAPNEIHVDVRAIGQHTREQLANIFLDCIAHAAMYRRYKSQCEAYRVTNFPNQVVKPVLEGANGGHWRYIRDVLAQRCLQQ